MNRTRRQEVINNYVSLVVAGLAIDTTDIINLSTDSIQEIIDLICVEFEENK